MSQKTQAVKHFTKNPELVNVHTAFTILSQINLLAESNALALDIGGSLAKLIYLQPHNSSKRSPPPLKIYLVDESVASALSVRVPILNGTLHFFAVETRNIYKLVRFIREHWAHSNPSHRHIRATGGGSYKYADFFREEIGVTLARLDEMKCTVAGLNFLLTSVENEVYVCDAPSTPRVISPLPDLTRARKFVNLNHRPFPYLLVNIGSGVSIVKVTDHDCYERISGSSLGGGTFWGLARLLLNCKTFDDVIDLTNSGDNANVDMLVGDIYGGSYPSLGLDANIIAASFGKATVRGDYSRDSLSTWARIRQNFVRAVSGTARLWLSFLSSLPAIGSLLSVIGATENLNSPPMLSTLEGDQFRPEDVALSLLRMLSYNIGQIAHLNARVHGLDRIYFGGNFIRDHPYTVADISYAVDFWSGGEMKALFLRHDGYLGAIGAFIGASSAAPTKIIEEQRVEQSKKRDTSNESQKVIVENVDSKTLLEVNCKTTELDSKAKAVGESSSNDFKDPSVCEKSRKPIQNDNDDSQLGETLQNGHLDDTKVNGTWKENNEEETKNTSEEIKNEFESRNKNSESGREKKKASNEKASNEKPMSTTNGQSKAKRKRGGGKSKNAGQTNGFNGASSDDTLAKVNSANVAVANGTPVAKDEFESDGWTTVRIRRRGAGGKDQTS